MTLTDLLTMQRELQTHSDTQPETLDQIRIAQFAELGEIVQAIKWGVAPVETYPAWAWWHRDSKVPAQRDVLAGELADLLCFMLLEIVCRVDNFGVLIPERDKWSDNWRSASRSGKFTSEGVWDNVHGLVSTGSVRRLEWFVYFCDHLGFTQSEIEAAYKAAYDKNVARWRS